MTRVFGSLVSLLAVLLVSCGGDDSSTAPAPDPEVQQRLAEFIEQTARVENQHVVLLERASADFTVDLSTEMPPPNIASRFDIEALVNLHRVYRVWLLSAYRLWETGFRGAAAGPAGRRTEPLLAGLVAVASLVTFVAAGWHGIHRVFLARAEPIFERLRTDVTPEELAFMADYLGIGTDADATTVDSTLRDLGPTGLQTAQRDIRNGIEQNGLDGMPGFRVWNGDEESRSIANAATEGGRVAVRQTANGLQMLRGSRSISDGLTAAGYSSDSSRLVQVALDGCGDVALDSFDAVFIGDPDPAPPELVRGPVGDDIDAAIATLEDTALTGAMADVAANTVIKHILDQSAASVPVPSVLHVGRAAGSPSIMLPAAGTGSLLIQPSARATQESEVDLTADLSVEYAFCAAPTGGVDAGPTDSGIDSGVNDAGDGGGGDAMDYTVCSWFNVDATDSCAYPGPCDYDGAPIAIRGNRDHPIYTRQRGVPTSGFRVTRAFAGDFILHDIGDGALPDEMVHGVYPANTEPGNGTNPSSSTSPLHTENSSEEMTVRWDIPIDQPGGVAIMWTRMTYVWGADSRCN